MHVILGCFHQSETLFVAARPHSRHAACSTVLKTATHDVPAEKHKYEQELNEGFHHDQWAMSAAPCPSEDDQPLPSRHLSRISQSSDTSDLSTHTAPLTAGQLHRMQLSDIVNLLLTDTSGQLSGPTPAQRAAAAGTAATQSNHDTEASHARVVHEIYRPQGHSSTGRSVTGNEPYRRSLGGAEPRGAHSPSASGTPHSETAGSVGGGSGGRAAVAAASTSGMASAFVDTDFSLGHSPPVQALQDAAPAKEGRSKWLGRTAQAHALSQDPRGSPLHRTAHRHSASVHTRAPSVGSDVLTRYTSATVPEDAAVDSGALHTSDQLEAQQ